MSLQHRNGSSCRLLGKSVFIPYTPFSCTSLQGSEIVRGMPSCTIYLVNSDSVLAIFWNLSGDSLMPLSFSSGIGGRARGSAPASLSSPSAIPVVAGGAVMACLILRFTRTLGTARLPSWAETCEVNTAKLVCNLAGRKPWPHPKGTGAQSRASIRSRSVTMKSR